jgi:hypothetical protein
MVTFFNLQWIYLKYIPLAFHNRGNNGNWFFEIFCLLSSYNINFTKDEDQNGDQQATTKDFAMKAGNPATSKLYTIGWQFRLLTS